MHFQGIRGGASEFVGSNWKLGLVHLHELLDSTGLQVYDEKNFDPGVIPGQLARDIERYNIYMNCNDASLEDNVREDGSIVFRFCAERPGIFPCSYEAVVTMTPK